ALGVQRAKLLAGNQRHRAAAAARRASADRVEREDLVGERLDPVVALRVVVARRFVAAKQLQVRLAQLLETADRLDVAVLRERRLLLKLAARLGELVLRRERREIAEQRVRDVVAQRLERVELR